MPLNKNRAKKKNRNRNKLANTGRGRHHSPFSFSFLAVSIPVKNLPATTSCSSKRKGPHQLAQSLLDWLASKPVVPVLSPQC